MDRPAPNDVAQVLGGLLRHPDPLREPELERALARLQAARPDAAYLLLHRVLVLELALGQLRSRGGTPAPGPAATPKPPPAGTIPRGLLRDIAVVTAGVVAGQALWQGLAGPSAADGAEGGDPGAIGDAPDVDGWL